VKHQCSIQCQQCTELRRREKIQEEYARAWEQQNQQYLQAKAEEEKRMKEIQKRREAEYK